MQLDMLVVGAGFAGIYQLYKAREAGMTVRVLEAGEGVGGTWFWNRYPGARCDVESLDYSYSFCRELEEEWEWTERYASQSEILSYINHVVDRFDLRRDIQLDTRVASAHFDEDRALWSVRSEDGEHLEPTDRAATNCQLQCARAQHALHTRIAEGRQGPLPGASRHGARSHHGSVPQRQHQDGGRDDRG